MHSAQGVTADASHAVLSENTSRALLYVAMTRGRYANTARIYQRISGDHEYGQQESEGAHLRNRGDSREAADLIRSILTNHDRSTITAHDYAAQSAGAALPDRVHSLLNRRAAATNSRKVLHQAWQVQAQDRLNSMHQSRVTHASRSRERDHGMEL